MKVVVTVEVNEIRAPGVGNIARGQRGTAQLQYVLHEELKHLVVEGAVSSFPRYVVCEVRLEVRGQFRDRESDRG